MEEKDLMAMTKEELIAKIKAQASTITDYAAVYGRLSAFRNVVTNIRVLTSSGKCTNTCAFYDAVIAADDALGYIADPRLGF